MSARSNRAAIPSGGAAPTRTVRDTRRRAADGDGGPRAQRDGAVASRSCRAHHGHAARANDVSKPGSARRGAGTRAPRHCARGDGQECGDGGGDGARVASGGVGVGVPRVGQVRARRHCRPVERPISGRRRRDCDRGSHGPRPGRRAAPAGGWHLSRHRDLGREHRDSHRAAARCRPVARHVAACRSRRGDCRAPFLRSDHRVGAVGGSRDLGGGPVPRRTVPRAARSVDQYPGRRGDVRPGVLGHGGLRSRLSPVVRSDAGHSRRRPVGLALAGCGGPVGAGSEWSDG